jgi:hypothetical protein
VREISNKPPPSDLDTPRPEVPLTVAEQLGQIRALMSEGHSITKALATIAHPYHAYSQWSILWDPLYEAQVESPRRTLHELQDLLASAELRALVDRAIAGARFVPALSTPLVSLEGTEQVPEAVRARYQRGEGEG